MGIAQWIIIIVMGVVCIYSYFKIAYALNREKFLSGMLGLMLMTAISLISLFLIATVMERNGMLEEQNKKGCPEYVPIENVYILKK